MGQNRAIFLVSVYLVITLSGCGEPEQIVSPKQVVSTTSTSAVNSRNSSGRCPGNAKSACPVGKVKELSTELEELLTKFTEEHPAVVALMEKLEACTASPEIRPGIWREQNGARVCDGYMTRFDGEDFCSACPPEDWEPFTFDGQTYYIQPLDGADND